MVDRVCMIGRSGLLARPIGFVCLVDRDVWSIGFVCLVDMVVCVWSIGLYIFGR